APHRLVAVCAINGEAEDAAASVQHWVGERGAVGIRFMELVRDQGIGWLDSETSRGAWRAAVDLDVPICVHFFPWNRGLGLDRLHAILTELPQARVVVDHFSNMDVNAGAPDFGLDERLARLEAFSGVAIKFTTIPLGRLDKAGVDSAPIVKRVVGHFGAGRVMWGSDVSQSPGTYSYMRDIGRASVSLLDEAQQALVQVEAVGVE
ncbi:MAG: amidohydrolase, partial [Alphaproteobacteria bacterium PA3]